jgi:AhpD family alkylhydroperoxidase
MDEGRDVHDQVSRLPGLPSPLDPLVAESFARSQARGSSILNLHLVNAHAPRLWQARIALAYALRAECVTPRRYRELAILRAAQLARCSYEETHHRPMAEAAGMSQEAVAAIATWTEHRDLFGAPELAILAWVDQVCSVSGDNEDETFAALARVFTPGEVVEITAAATTYYAGGLFIRALSVQNDPAHLHAAPG